MALLRPSDIQLKKKSAGVLLRIRVYVYRALLKLLMKSYSRYAVSDTVLVGNGHGKIVHESRDLEFESELARNGIDVRPHLVARSVPVHIPAGGYGCMYRYFRFKDVLDICLDDEELYIEHSDAFVIEGPSRAIAKVSPSEDLICRGQIRLQTGKRSAEDSGIPDTGTEKKPAEDSVIPESRTGKRRDKETGLSGKEKKRGQGRMKGNMFGRDVIPDRHDGPAHIGTVEAHGNPAATELAPVLEKRGFEIDTTF